MLMDETKLQLLEWKQYRMILKPWTNPLNNLLVVFKCKENN